MGIRKNPRLDLYKNRILQCNMQKLIKVTKKKVLYKQDIIELLTN